MKWSGGHRERGQHRPASTRIPVRNVSAADPPAKDHPYIKRSVAVGRRGYGTRKLGCYSEALDAGSSLVSPDSRAGRRRRAAVVMRWCVAAAARGAPSCEGPEPIDAACVRMVPMLVPETHYARAGDLRIAYQQWGEGPPLVFIPALISNVEISWEHELYRRNFEHFGRHMTCVQFDKRGIGLSDRFEGVPTMEQRNEDIFAVMDAVGWERAHFLGVSEGAAMAQLFAANFPERVESLALVNTFVSPQYRHRYPDYVQDGDAPLLGVDGIVERFMHIASLWSEDPRPMVEWEMPSAIDNESFIRWGWSAATDVVFTEGFHQATRERGRARRGRRPRTHNDPYARDACQGRSGVAGRGRSAPR